MIPKIRPPDSFCICNIESSRRPGSHWVMVAQKDGIVFFWRLSWEGSDVSSQHSFEAFRCSHDSELSRKTKRTLVWPILYLFRTFLVLKLSPIQCR